MTSTTDAKIEEATIFVLDDDRAMRDSLQVLFDVLKMPARFFRSVPEFLAVYQRPASGCILLDLRLPGDGFSLLRDFAERDDGLPIVVMTGHGDEEVEAQVKGLGAFAFFEKPFDSRLVCQQLQVAMEQSRLP